MAEETMRKKIRVKTVILLIFITLTAFTVLLVSGVFYLNWKSSTETYISKIADTLSDEVVHQVDLFVEEPLKLNETHRVYLENGIINFEDSSIRDLFFYNGLNTVKNDAIYSFSFGTITGEYYGARKNTRNSIEIMINDHSTLGHSWYFSVNDEIEADVKVIDAGEFDPRTRDWYKEATNSGSPIFSPIYSHFIMDDLAISAASPIYDSNSTLKGVLGTHLTLSRVNDFLRQISEPYNGTSYIVDSSGFLIGNSLRRDNFKRLEDRIERMHLNDMNHLPVVDAFEDQHQDRFSSKIISDAYGHRHVQVTPYRNYGLDWMIITMIPVDSFLESSFESIVFTLFVTFITFGIAVYAYFKITKIYFKPFYRLVEVVEQFANGNYSERIVVENDDEFGKLAISYNHMADAVSKTVSNLESDVRTRSRALEQNREQLDTILNSTAEGIVGIESDGVCMFCNKSALDLLGYEAESDFIGKSFHELVHMPNEDHKGTCEMIQAIQSGQSVHSLKTTFYKSDGSPIDVELHLQIMRIRDTENGAVMSFTDITERKKSEERVEFLSKHDSLTGLYNRLYLERYLTEYYFDHQGPMAFIICDVNGLKLTNDIFGHKAGDQLIITAAQILMEITQDKGIAARVGGDEFIVLKSNILVDEAKNIADYIKTKYAQSDLFAFKGTISVGYSVQLSKDETYEYIISEAEDMMYMDKALNSKQMKKEAIQDLIAKLHALDPFEREHALNVANLSYELATFIGLSKGESKRVKEAGYLHDIGKITLSLKALENETHFFSATEKDQFEHSITGYRILNAFEDTLDLAEVILYHHERWDGKGQPKQLVGKEIPLFSRIIAIVEAFDELTSRLYLSTLTDEEALAQLNTLKGTYFDPDLLDAFIRMRKTPKLEEEK